MEQNKGEISGFSKNLLPRPHPFVNRKKEISQILDALLEDNISIIALIGVAGIGKTTLAREVVHRLLDMQESPIGIIWLNGRDLQKKEDVNQNFGFFKEYTRPDSLKCLVIIDGLDELDQIISDNLLEKLPSKCKALVTSRKEIDFSKPMVNIQIGPLDERAALELYTSLVKVPIAARQMAKEIVSAFGSHPLALTLAANLVRGDFAQARRFFDQSLDSLAGMGSDKERAAMLNALAFAAQTQEKTSEALELYRQSIEISERLNDLQGKSAAINNLGRVYFTRGEYERALTLYRESLEIKERLGDLWGKSATLNNMAQLYFTRGDLDGALGLYNESLVILDQIGDKHGKATTLNNLAQIYSSQGDLNHALDIYQTTLATLEEIGDEQGKAIALNNLAQIFYKQGDYNRALSLFQDSLELFEEQGDLYNKSILLNNLAQNYGSLGKFESALASSRESLNLSQYLGMREQSERTRLAIAKLSYELGKEYIEQDRWYDALQLFEESLRIFRQGENLDLRADAIYQIARTHHLMGNLDNARMYYRDALRLYNHTMNQAGIADCQTGLGRLMIQEGLIDDAIRELESARKTYKQINAGRGEAQVDRVLQMANYIREKQVAYE